MCYLNVLPKCVSVCFAFILLNNTSRLYCRMMVAEHHPQDDRKLAAAAALLVTTDEEDLEHSGDSSSSSSSEDEVKHTRYRNPPKSKVVGVGKKSTSAGPSPAKRRKDDQTYSTSYSAKYSRQLRDDEDARARTNETAKLKMRKKRALDRQKLLEQGFAPPKRGRPARQSTDGINDSDSDMDSDFSDIIQLDGATGKKGKKKGDAEMEGMDVEEDEGTESKFGLGLIDRRRLTRSQTRQGEFKFVVTKIVVTKFVT